MSRAAQLKQKEQLQVTPTPAALVARHKSPTSRGGQSARATFPPGKVAAAAFCIDASSGFVVGAGAAALASPSFKAT